MKFLIAGCGSIGKRHLRNLGALEADNILAFDTREDRRKEAEQLGARAFADFAVALAQKPDAVLICTPTSLHIDYALPAAKAGCHLFIEKPLSHSMYRVDELIRTAESKNNIILVGCNFRFHWGLTKAKKLVDEGAIGKILSARAEFGQYLPDWHPYEDYRQGYSANKLLGGGIILDAIHEIDYTLWFLGKVDMISCFSGKLSSLPIDTADSAEIMLNFKNGSMASVHMDYVQRAYTRTCKLMGEEGTIQWTFPDELKLYSAKVKEWQVYKPENTDVNQMYIDEMKHFIRCIDKKEKPVLDGADGKYDLEVALAAMRSADTGKLVMVD